MHVEVLGILRVLTYMISNFPLLIYDPITYT